MANLLGGDNHRTTPEKLAHTARYEKKRFFFRPARSREPFFSAAKTEKVNVYQGSGRENIREARRRASEKPSETDRITPKTDKIHEKSDSFSSETDSFQE